MIKDSLFHKDGGVGGGTLGEDRVQFPFPSPPPHFIESFFGPWVHCHTYGSYVHKACCDVFALQTVLTGGKISTLVNLITAFKVLAKDNRLFISQAKLLFMPVQFSFLSGVVAVVVFVLLLMLQLGIIAGKNKYLWEEDPIVKRTLMWRGPWYEQDPDVNRTLMWAGPWCDTYLCPWQRG